MFLLSRQQQQQQQQDQQQERIKPISGIVLYSEVGANQNKIRQIVDTHSHH